jgi:hypothetical protein
MPSSVLIDERAPLEPTSHWGKSKVACEQTLVRAAEKGAFKLTIARLGHTYGPGDSMNDQQDSDGLGWDRAVRGLPVFCAGDGLGLWQSTHRDDVAKFFAFAALAPQTYGQAFNVMRDEVLTWRDYYREVARALDCQAKLIFVPASWLIAQDTERFSFLAEISQFHAAYSSAGADRLKARTADRRRRGGLLPETPNSIGDSSVLDRAGRDRDPAVWRDRFQSGATVSTAVGSSPRSAPMQPSVRARTSLHHRAIGREHVLALFPSKRRRTGRDHAERP